MRRERVVELALRAYPRKVRQARGAEMRDTMLEVSGRSWRRLASESLTLAIGGARAHASEAAALGGRRLVADSCALAATVWGLTALVGMLQFERYIFEVLGYRGSRGTLEIILTVLLAASVALALIGRDRLAGLCGLAWIGLSLAALASESGPPVRELLAYLPWLTSRLVPFGCYAVMIVSPRGRRRDLRRLLWVVGAALLGLLATPGSVSIPGLVGVAGLLILAIAVACVLSLATDPRRSIAFALALIALGLSRAVTETTRGLEVHYYGLQFVITTLVPMAVLAGMAVRLVSARRRLPS